MRVLVKLFLILFFIGGLAIVICGEKGERIDAGDVSLDHAGIPGTEEKSPWNDYGYEKLSQFHLRFYYIFGEAIEKVLKGKMGWEEAVKNNTGVVEVWFRADGNLFRLDRYIEKLDAKCESYKGAPPDTISRDDKIYSLYERLIQKGTKFTSYTFHSGEHIGYDDQTKQALAKNCSYEEFTQENKKPVEQGSAISWMKMGHQSGAGFGFYLNERLGGMEADFEEAEESALELIKLMNPPEYKKIIESWKVKKEIAGRKAVKDYGSPPTIMGVMGMRGFQFIDIELGIGLAGYLEGCPKSYMYKETKFKEPKLVYKALLVETTVSPDAFEII